MPEALYIPLSRYIAVSSWAIQDLLPDSVNFLDDVAYVDGYLSADDDGIYIQGRLRVMREVAFDLVGDLAIVVGDGNLDVVCSVDADGVAIFAEAEIVRVRLPRRYFIPAIQQDGKHIVDPDPDHFVDIDLPVSVSISNDWEIDFNFPSEVGSGVSLPPCLIGKSGILISADDIEFKFSAAGILPDGALGVGIDESWRGVYFATATIEFPDGLASAVPSTVEFNNCYIGKGGFTGKAEATWDPTFQGAIGRVDFALSHFELEIRQNAIVAASLEGQITIPFFEKTVDVEVGITAEGELTVNLSATGGLYTLSLPNVLDIELDSLGFEIKNGELTTKLSGKLTPTVPGLNWPSFDVRDLSIDSKGHIHLDGGFIPLLKSYSIDFHGAKLEITKFGMGTTDDDGKYIAMSGAVELVKGMPAGASVEGLRITWYKSGPASLTFNGIGIKFETPALSFDGHVSYIQVGGDHQFKGDLTVVIPAANELTLIGKAVFGFKNGTKYFAIYLEGEFGTGLPLGATGLALNAFAGLLAVNYAPDKPGTMLWYSVNHSQSYFHKPQTGVTDIVGKWKPEAGTFAIGAGITLATYTDGGYAFNGKFLLLLLCPGPVLMIDGSAAVLRRLSDKSEPPFHGLIVWDNRAGYFMVGLDARWKKDAQQGDVADISGSMEVFFNFHDPRLWHLWLGKQDPVAQRIQARFAKAFTANTYFMLDARQLAVGVWIGTSNHYKWGPVGADLEAWMAADAIVNFKPSQFHANIEFYGHFAIKVFRFQLAITMDATLTADVAKPFHIKGALDITIETRIKDFHIHMALEWGPRIIPPDMHVPELLPVQSWGITHRTSSNEWPLQLPQAAEPVVPVDGRPYFTFAFPMHDLHGVGVNSTVPTPEWTIIGDPVTGAGTAKAKFSLTGITLYRVDGSIETAIAAHPKPANSAADFGDIYGSWAPSIPGTSGGQNKLMLWSANPLDFADNTASWNPWLSSNLPGYPCPDTKPETICMDFEHVDLGEQLYGSGWQTQNLDFQLAWSDAGPHPIVAAPPPASQTLDRGLLFPAPKPRKRYRAYVSNFFDNTVSVVDLVTRKVIVTIPVGAHPRQVVLSPDGKRAYVCNQDDSSVIVIDTVMNQRVGAPIAVIHSPDSIAISRDGERAFVPSGVDPTMSVINLQSLQVTTVKLPAVANQAAPSPDGIKLYVMHAPVGAISVFAADSLAIVKTLKAAGGPAAMVIHPKAPHAWISFPSRGTVRLFDTIGDELTALETPTGKFARDLALSLDGSRLYVGNLQENAVSVLDTVTLDVLATIATPGPAGLQTAPDGSALLVTNYFANTIAVIDPIQNQVIAGDIAAGHGSNSIALLETPPQMAYRAFVANQNAVAVLELKTGKVLASIPVGHTPLWIALTPDGKRAYVSNKDDNTVTAIDTSTNTTIGGPIPVVTRPESIAITADGKRAVVRSGAEPHMSVIDLTLAQVTATISVGSAGDVVVLSADGTKGYAINGPANTMDIFSPISLAVTKVVPTRTAAESIALHPLLPRAYVSFPNDDMVREFDTNTEEFTKVFVATGKFPQDLCFSPDGSRLYVCNFQSNTISVIDSATNQITATIPTSAGPKDPVFTADGSLLVVGNYLGAALTLIDPAVNQVLGNPIPCPGMPYSLVLQGTATQEKPLPFVPVEVTIDVPAGSSSVEVTWAGKGPLRGMVSMPPAQTMEIVAAAGSELKLDVALLDQSGTGLARSGIDQIRLRCDSAWTLLRVCVTRLPFAGGLAAQQTLNSALQQQVTVLKKPAFLLDPGQEYRLHLEWKASVKGLNALANWSESFTGAKDLKFSTAMPPPLLGKPSDPNIPPKTPSTLKGLDDLSLYVRRTIPVTQTPNDHIPVLTKPVFCGYDVTVEFNESYVDQLYQMAGKDLDLLLFDRNNELVRDASGSLIIVEDAWANAPTLTLTDTQALWIDMFNANTCEFQPIDLTTIPTSKVLRASAGHVLAADTVYEARLVPQLAHQLVVAGEPWTTEPFAAGAQIWPSPSAGPRWTDYRVSVLVTLIPSDQVSILFRCTNSTSPSYYEFTINPGARKRTLTLVNVGKTTTLDENYLFYGSGNNALYRIHIEAVGSQIRVSQNGTIVFVVTDSTLPTGTVGLWQSAGQAVFKDFGVSDLSTGAPVAYSFDFTTSKFANFYHQIHSYQGVLWREALSGGPQMSALLAQVGTDQEWRAYDEFASQVLGSDSAQDPPQFEVTRVERGGDLLCWFLRSPEPIDRKRTDVLVTIARAPLGNGSAPGSVKIAEAQLANDESVTLLARDACDISGSSLQYLQMPAALADGPSNRVLWKSRPDSGPIPINETFGDSSWLDYRIKATLRPSAPGDLGFCFRKEDDKNFYSFVLSTDTGVQKITKTVNGVPTILADAPGDPCLGIIEPVAVSLIGSTITAYRNGEKVLEVTDSGFIAGGVCTIAPTNLQTDILSLEVREQPIEVYALFQAAFSSNSISVSGWQTTPDDPGLQLKPLAGSSWTDYVVRARVSLFNDADAGVLFRYVDPLNHYRFVVAKGERRFERVVAGMATVLWQVAGAPVINRVLDLDISLHGGRICIFQDSILIGEVFDTQLPAGGVGVFARGNASFDCPQFLVHPSDRKFSQWTFEDDLSAWVPERWTIVDEGQNGPSAWSVDNGRLVQTSAISDSDPVKQRGTMVVVKGSGQDSFRLVVGLRAPADGPVGIVFGYQDSGNLYRLSLDGGKSTRLLVQLTNGVIQEIWKDGTALNPLRDYILTVDLVDDHLRAWLDGDELFHIGLPGQVQGDFGLYCSGNPNASFAHLRIGIPAWIAYHSFGYEPPLSAGHRVLVAPDPPPLSPNSSTTIRTNIEPGESLVRRLPLSRTHLRVIDANQNLIHSNEFLPAADFAPHDFQPIFFNFLWKTDGTGILMIPTAPVPFDTALRVRLLFHRDNRGRDLNSVVFSEAGSADLENVYIDIPSEALN